MEGKSYGSVLGCRCTRAIQPEAHVLRFLFHVGNPASPRVEDYFVRVYHWRRDGFLVASGLVGAARASAQDDPLNKVHVSRLRQRHLPQRAARD